MVLFTFLLSFIAARVLVFLVMDHFVLRTLAHFGGVYVNDLNFGSFPLAAVGAFLLLMRPAGQGLLVMVVIYAIGLALAFNEFGLWLHFSGDDRQRAGFDAVTVSGACLGLLPFLPNWRAIR